MSSVSWSMLSMAYRQALMSSLSLPISARSSAWLRVTGIPAKISPGKVKSSLPISKWKCSSCPGKAMNTAS